MFFKKILSYEFASQSWQNFALYLLTYTIRTALTTVALIVATLVMVWCAVSLSVL